MRKTALIALLIVCALLLTGCDQFTQVENLAYVILFGVDLVDDGQIEISVQIPKITGSEDKEGSGQSGSSNDLIYSASGADFPEALSNLIWAVPRRVDLSQIELIVISEKLARSDRFMEIMNEMMDTNRLYTAARLAVCSGGVQDFIRAEKPVIGNHIANELSSMFADYTRNGYIPDVTFADVYYKSISIYSDPLVIYAEQSPKNTSGSEKNAKTAALVIPDTPSDTSAEMEQSNRFLGSAVLRNGVMVGKLNGSEQLMSNLLRGKKQSFTYTRDGKSFYLTTLYNPKISVDVRSEPATIRISLRLSLLPDSDTTQIDSLCQALEQDLLDTIENCRTMGVEPFEIAEVAARSFPTIDQWVSYDWRKHFLESRIELDVTMHSENL